MASDIESKPFVFDRPGEPAHIPRILLENHDFAPIPGELIPRRETRRPRTDYYDAPSEVGIQNVLTLIDYACGYTNPQE